MPDLSFGSHTLPVYRYEDFSFTISNPGPVDSITRTAGLPDGTFTTTPSNLTFAGNGNAFTSGSVESFSYVVGGVTSSNTVPVGVGRLTDLSGNGVGGNAYVFFKNEPISNIRLKAPFPLSNAMSSVPSLPPGLRFVVSGSNLDISGTPLTTLPTSNYLLIGKDISGSKIVTTSNTYTVSNERIVYNLSGTPVVSLTIGTPIDTHILTASFPPYPSGGVLKYTWDALPDGIRVYDGAGNDKTSSNGFGFSTADVSHAFVISGTPTVTAARDFSNAFSKTSIIRGTRTSPLPAISNTASITFSFSETVLFDTVILPSFYTDVPLDPSANSFYAKTYFGTSPITDIFSPDLRADLSLTFVSNQSRAYLSGMPNNTIGTANYTIRAINSNNISQDYIVPITVQNDIITFQSPTPAVDTCYNFILSRPLDLAKSGYYTSPIRFVATAASGLPVTLSAPGLAGTGISLSSNGTLVGTPDTVTPLTTLTVTATTTSATSSRTTQFEVLDDIFTFGNVASSNFQFVQNRAITPFQIPVTTLSERAIVDFTETNLPSGISVSPAGVVSGIPNDVGVTTATFTATTGYTSGSRDFSYNVIPDSILFQVPQLATQYWPSDYVSVPVTAIAYSGITVSNFTTDLSSSYGLTIQSITGLLNGQLNDGMSFPSVYLNPSNFAITGRAGLIFTEDLSASIQSSALYAMWFTERGGSGDTLNSSLRFWDGNSAYRMDRVPYNEVMNFATSDIQFKNNSNTSNAVLVVSPNMQEDLETPAPYFIKRGELFTNVREVQVLAGNRPSISSIANKTGTSIWWGAGSVHEPGGRTPTIFQTGDDGFTWYLKADVGTLPIQTRDMNRQFDTYTNPVTMPYLRDGLALKYSDGVWILGGIGFTAGTSMLRSVNETNWLPIPTGFKKECGYINVDNNAIWVATGSYEYLSSEQNRTDFTLPTSTIKYSTDKGETWEDVSGGFSMNGYELAYGNGTWFATGISATLDRDSGEKQYTYEVRKSTDGSNWSLVDLSSSPLFPPITSAAPRPPLPIGSLAYDGSNWNIFVNREITPGVYGTQLYRSSNTTDWSVTNITGLESTANENRRILALTSPHFMLGQPGPPINIVFSILNGSGPTRTAPTQLSYLFYQYIPISPIQVSATGSGIVYFFIDTDTLPPGLTFDPLTNQIIGKPAQLGRTQTDVYIKDANGVTRFTLTFTIVLPRIIRKQDGAGASTSLLRQYTEVLGAQGGRDNRVLPNQERALGEFMSPQPPDVITQTIDPKCKNPNC